jgi:predicted phosphodiesterase
MRISLTGDWHLDGTKASKKHVQKWIKKMKGTSLILLGDMMDSGISKGMNWNQNNLTEQLFDMQDIIKNQDVLGYVLGNHEMRIWRQVGLNPYASLLGREKDIYKIDGRLICIAHGTRVPQDILRQVRDLAKMHPTANVCALGHNHELVSSINYLGQWLVRTGHLQIYPDYAKRAMMAPKMPGYVEYNTETNEVKLITELKRAHKKEK